MQIEWWIVLATLAGPVIAVQTQKWIERSTERRRGKLQVFYWLMATRATRIAVEHVQALNRIELEFRGRNNAEKKVREAWKLYADKLNEQMGETEGALAAWAVSRDQLFTELLFSMSNCLGFDFDRVQLKRGIYYPRGHGESEERQQRILVGLEAILSGTRPIPMKVTEFPASPDLIAAQVAMAEKATQAYGDDGALKVRMVERERRPRR